jgi:hypothetical protein
LTRRIAELEKETSAGQHEYRRQIRNAALDEAALLCDQQDDYNWSSVTLARKIRALKEE